MRDDEDERGELVAFDAGSSDVEDTEDGGAIVTLDEEAPKADGEFYANLAETMPEWDLSRIATDLVDLIGKDRDARKRRDEQYREGLQRTGLGDDAPGGADFEGASKVVHPMLTEACVDFASRSIKELWPANGPVKSKIEGEQDAETIDKAERKTKLMNWQLTVQCKDARAEVEQLLTQVPLGGAQYLKVSWAERQHRPNFVSVMIDDMLLPYSATNFYSAQRKTHVQYLTRLEFDQRVRDGMYRDIDAMPTSMEPEASASEQANNRIEGRSDTGYNEDGLRTVYEVYATLEIDEEHGPCPYIISIDKTANKVLSIYRNWAEDDDDAKSELTWIVEFPFIPWRGAYPIGLPHMIGGLSAAATGALRALLDSAHIQNSATGLKLKGATGGQNRSPKVGEIVEVDGGLQTDDIRKLFMPMPYNPPSATLMNLLSFLVDAGKGVVRTALDDVADGNPNAPVGTTLAKLEQGMVVYAAIHGRLHDAMGRVLDILHRLNALYLDDEAVAKAVGEGVMATREDFEGPMGIVPVSDPNIFSEAQRFAQVQAVVQRADHKPMVYNQRKVEERLLDVLKVPNPDELLMPAVDPEAQNAVSENVAASLGRPIVAFPEQDHMAHLQTHLAFLTNPALGGNPLFAQTFLPGIVNHMREHVALWYMQASIEVAEEASGLVLDDMVKEHESAEDNRGLDRLLATSSTLVSKQAVEVFADIMPLLAQVQQQVEQMMQPPPLDPSQVMAQKAQMDAQTAQARLQLQGQQVQQKAQADAAKLAQTAQLEQQKLELQQQLAAIDAQMDAQRLAAEDRHKQQDIDAKLAMNEADNATAMALAQAEIESGESFAVSTGTGINPQP